MDPLTGNLRDLSEALGKLDRLIGEAAADRIPAIVVALSARIAMAAARAMDVRRDGEAAAPTPPAAKADGLLSRKQAADRRGVAVAWLKNRRGKLPFEVRMGPRTPRYDPQGIDRWIRRRQGNPSLPS